MNKIYLISGVMFLMIITLVSCKREVQNIDISNGANNNDFIVIDTFSIITHSVREDSLPTSKLSSNHLGAITSLEFGKINASMALSFSLPNSSNFAFPTTTNIDSVVLVLEYASSTAYNGNINTPQEFDVFEITKRLYKDTVYYSTAPIEFNSTAIGTFASKFNPTDSFVHVLNNNTEKQSPQLRIVLDKNTFGNKLANSGTNLSSNENFQNYINGLYIKTKTFLVPNSGVIARFATLGTNSGIRVYYNDTSSVLFPIGATGVAFNKYENEFGGSVVSNQFAGGNFDNVYLNSLASTKISLEVPYLTKILENADYSVVAASFQFHVDPSTIIPGFEPPSKINLFKKNQEGNSIVTFEQAYANDLYDGNYNTTENMYSFGVNTTIQEILYQYKHYNKKIDFGYFVAVRQDNPNTSSRVILDTRKNIPNAGVKLKLSLVKIK